MAIAIELHVDRKTVRRARERLGIPAAAPGRRRGITTARREVMPTALLIVSRYAQDQRAQIEPTEDLVADRIHAAHNAQTAGDGIAYDDALLALASAAGLLVDHRRKQRAA